MIKRETVCLTYYNQGKCLSTLFLLHEGMSLEGFLLIPTLLSLCLSLSQEMATYHLIPDPGGTRSGLECEAFSKFCHFLVFLRDTGPVPAAVSTKALPLSWDSWNMGLQIKSEQSSASCRWPRLAGWKSSFWMSQEGNCLLSLFPLKKHSYTHR